MVTAMIAVTTFGPTGLIAQEDPEKRGLKEESQTSEKGGPIKDQTGTYTPWHTFFIAICRLEV